MANDQYLLYGHSPLEPAPGNTSVTTSGSQNVQETETEFVPKASSNPASGYAGADYADWYRHYFGTDYNGTDGMAAKPDWMSATDYSAGLLHYNYNKNMAASAGAKENAIRAAEQQRRSELEYAGILYERMKKYLPDQLRSSGMSKMGVAQTAMNDVTSEHLNRRSAINSVYNENVMGINNSFQEKAASMDEAYLKNLLSIQEAQEDEADQVYDDNFSALLAHLDSYTDPEELKEYWEKYGSLWNLNEADNLTVQNIIQKAFDDQSADNFDKIMEVIASKGSADEAHAYYETVKDSLTEDQRKEALDAIYLRGDNEWDAKNEETKDAIEQYLAEGHTTQEMKDFLKEAETYLDDEVYEAFLGEIENMAATNEQKLIDMQAQRNDEVTAKELAALEAGYSSAEEYEAAIISGDEKIEIVQGIVSNAKGKQIDLAGKNFTAKISSEALDKDSKWLGTVFEYNLEKLGITNAHSTKIPNGTVVMSAAGGKVKFVIRFNNSWYLCDDIDQSENK